MLHPFIKFHIISILRRGILMLCYWNNINILKIFLNLPSSCMSSPTCQPLWLWLTMTFTAVFSNLAFFRKVYSNLLSSMTVSSMYIFYFYDYLLKLAVLLDSLLLPATLYDYLLQQPVHKDCFLQPAVLQDRSRLDSFNMLSLVLYFVFKSTFHSRKRLYNHKCPSICPS